MTKIKKAYFCQSCGHQSPKWMGKCPSCDSWNTLVEEIVQKEEAKKGDWKTSTSRKVANKPRLLKEIKFSAQERVITPDEELNRVLGGGIVPGSLVLIGGEPGIGKSTLMLQIALTMHQMKVLYVSGEESEQQIKMRADRITQQNEGLVASRENCYILTETSTQNIFKQIEEFAPQILVIDSIQTLHSSFLESSAGTVSQVRECTAELLKFAKESQTPVFLIGHINKEGSIAGPKVLEHMVDTVLQFEGDRHLVYRILRATKNRFGSTSELAIYEMLGDGLREVSNPSEILISQRDDDLSGISIGATLEGNRPLLIEVQSLVSTSNYGTPQRSSTGFDGKRLNMLLAVLEKRGGFMLGNQDVFLNITGGLKIEDPAIDLAVCVSVASSYNDISVSNDMCFAAEVGLGGEIRAVNKVENRISEAEKLGFKEIYISKYALKSVNQDNYTIKIKAFGKVEEVFEDLFG
ncbi:DNA repair protein RadA [Microscilla marina]|uniref:DNA repair protein RadA n=1 Tax=Microscilla marina ATCC 23134 TaxID=313606 RepID=A1ZHG1_MICM2|nr:DNA repair protein RadA [Microscilla marina]EAY29968.1 DNA repair protein RadA [Microscilla marina ATCC 23134]